LVSPGVAARRTRWSCEAPQQTRFATSTSTHTLRPTTRTDGNRSARTYPCSGGERRTKFRRDPGRPEGRALFGGSRPKPCPRHQHRKRTRRLGFNETVDLNRRWTCKRTLPTGCLPVLVDEEMPGSCARVNRARGWSRPSQAVKVAEIGRCEPRACRRTRFQSLKLWSPRAIATGSRLCRSIRRSARSESSCSRVRVATGSLVAVV
jgi:hypothetical protein